MHLPLERRFESFCVTVEIGLSVKSRNQVGKYYFLHASRGGEFADLNRCKMILTQMLQHGGQYGRRKICPRPERWLHPLHIDHFADEQVRTLRETLDLGRRSGVASKNYCTTGALDTERIGA